MEVGSGEEGFSKRTLEIFGLVSLHVYQALWFDFSSLSDPISPPWRKIRTQKGFVTDTQVQSSGLSQVKGKYSP